ncbi:MAG: alkaline phosphatase family protein [Proteobacteria bacterium]|nr:alkaline phosphatase family protein [Burkholderiales bacterium]
MIGAAEVGPGADLGVGPRVVPDAGLGTLPHAPWDAPAVMPDYRDASLVNLMASIEAGTGGVHAERSPHRTLALLPPARVRAARRIVLLVIDGLGDGYLATHGRDTAFAEHRVGRMTSVFPSTTATAISTFLTGAAPREHGLTGWHIWLEEIGRVATILPFRTRGERRLLRELGVNPLHFFAQPTPLAARLATATATVSPRWIIDSDYNLAHNGPATRFPYQTRDQFFDQIFTAVQSTQARQFIYAYYPEIDANSHDHGTRSLEVAAELWRLDQGLRSLLARLAGSDTLVIVTADHGFIDAPEARAIEIDAHPEIAAMLAHPLCGERRLAYAYVNAGMHAQFERAVQAQLGHALDLLPSPQAIAAGWFGIAQGRDHPMFARRIGDYLLMMRPGWTIKDWVAGENRHRLVGVHGGTTADEMYVPLVVCEC